MGEIWSTLCNIGFTVKPKYDDDNPNKQVTLETSQGLLSYEVEHDWGGYDWVNPIHYFSLWSGLGDSESYAYRFENPTLDFILNLIKALEKDDE